MYLGTCFRRLPATRLHLVYTRHHLFLFAAYSFVCDELDGRAARTFNQMSTFGAVLDMVTDRQVNYSCTILSSWLCTQRTLPCLDDHCSNSTALLSQPSFHPPCSCTTQITPGKRFASQHPHYHHPFAKQQAHTACINKIASSLLSFNPCFEPLSAGSPPLACWPCYVQYTPNTTSLSYFSYP